MQQNVFSLFSPSWYRESYGALEPTLATLAPDQAFEHYVSEGYQRGFSPNPMFDVEYFRRTVRHDHSRADLLVYADEASLRQVSPTPYFDEGFYLRMNPDVEASIRRGEFANGYHHFVSMMGQENRWFHPLFNAVYYRRKYNVESMTAGMHFALVGRLAGYVPTPLFDVDWYLLQPGVQAELPLTSNLPFEHFVANGIHRNLSPLPDFDIDFYLTDNPDIADALNKRIIKSAFNHFVNFGATENRKPNRYFDAEFYYWNNPSVQAAVRSHDYRSSFEHFMAGFDKAARVSRSPFEMPVAEDDTKAAFLRMANLHLAAGTRSARKRKPPEKPTLSLIVPVFNQVELTAQFLEETLPLCGSLAEIIVVDDGSTDSTERVVRRYPEVVYTANQRSKGYPGACNTGADVARGRYLVFCNNDVRLIGDSMRNLVDAFEENPNLGAVGGMILRTHGLLQEAGSLVFRDGGTMGYGRDLAPTDPRVLRRRPVDYCSGCFLGVLGSAFTQVGGFDEDYAPGYFEETDLCARLWRADFEVWYDPRVKLVHFEYASFSKGRPPAASQGRIAQKRKLFIRKNLDYLEHRLSYSPGIEHVIADVRSADRPVVVLFEDHFPSSSFGSGFSRSRSVFEWFVERGYYCVVVCAFRASGHQAADLDLADLPATYVFLDEIGNLRNFLGSLPNLSGIWVCRSHNFVRFADALQDVKTMRPKVPVILDTEAIASVREQFGHLPKEWQSRVDLHGAVARELAPADFVDAVVYVNEVDRELAGLAGAKPRAFVLPGVGATCEAVVPFEERSNIVFLGAVHSASAPNYDSIVWFLRHVWPDLREDLPGVEFEIAGRWLPNTALPPEIQTTGVRFVGEVADLAGYLSQKRIFVAPTWRCAGIPQKIIDGLAAGVVAVVSDPLAVQLTHGKGCELPSFSNPEQCREMVRTLYADRRSWNAACSTGQTLYEGWFSQKVFGRSLDGIVDAMFPAASRN